MMIRAPLLLHSLLFDRRGLTALEYGLIGSIIFGIIFAGFLVLADDLSTQFTNIGDSL